MMDQRLICFHGLTESNIADTAYPKQLLPLDCSAVKCSADDSLLGSRVEANVVGLRGGPSM